MQETIEKDFTISCPVDHHGQTIAVHGWKAKDKSEEIPLLLIPDVGEDYHDVSALAVKLSDCGYNAYSFEIRGLAKSSYSMANFEHLISDVLQVTALVKNREEGIAPVLISQGIGALLSLYITRAHSHFIQGLVLCSPTLSLQQKIRPMNRLILRIISRFLPRLKIPKSLYPPLSVKSNLNKYKMTAELADEFLTAIPQSRKMLTRTKTSILIICASEDPIVGFEFLKRLMTKSKNPKNLSILNIDSESHLLLTHPSATSFNDTVSYILNWLNNHIKGLNHHD